MRHLLLTTTAACCLIVLTGPSVRAENTVTISNVHLCCNGCVRGVERALKKVEGLTFECSQEDRTVKVTAANVRDLQQGIDQLAAAGFHGKLDNEQLRFKPVNAPSGKVGRLVVGGVHNCCGACTRAIKKALSKVHGIEIETSRAKQQSFVVEGNFSAAALVEAMLNAGFHLKVKQ